MKTPSRRYFTYGILALLLLLGWASTTWRLGRQDFRMRENLLIQAVEIAAAVEPELVKQLSFSSADRDNPAFERIRKQMVAYGRCIKQNNIHRLAIRNGRLVFGPENLDPKDPIASPPGTVYEQPQPGQWSIFKTKVPEIIGPYSDEYGSFVGAFAPVLDPDSGEVLMGVGLDVLLEEWSSEKLLLAAPPLLFSAAISLLAALLALLLWRRGKLPEERQASGLNYLEVAAAALFGVCVSAAVSFVVYEAEQNERREIFERKSLSAGASTEGFITSIKDSFASIAALAADKEIGNADPTLLELLRQTAERAGLRQIALIWPIKGNAAHPDRTVRELAHSRSYSWSRNSLGQWRLESNGASAEAMHSPALYALQTGTPAATTRKMHQPGKALSTAIIYCQPLNSKGPKPPMGDVTGALCGEIRSQDLLNKVGLEHQKNLKLALVALDESAGNDTLAAYPPDSKAHLKVPLTAPHFTDRSLFQVQPISFGGNVYALINTPSHGFLETYPLNAAWQTLFGGLLLTIGLTAFVWFIHNQDVQIGRLVTQLSSVMEDSRLDLWNWDAHAASPVLIGRILEILGYSPGELEPVTGDTWRGLCHPGDIQRFSDLLQQHLDRKSDCFECVFRMRRKSGEWAWLHTHGRVTARDKDGKAFNMAGITLDITDRKRAEQALQKSEERFAQIAALSREFIWETDAQGLFTYVSRECLTLLGYREEEVAGRLHFYDLIDADTREEARRRVFETFQRRGPLIDFHNHVVTKDGRVLDALTNGVPIIDEHGELLGYRGANRDITVQKRAEKELRAAKEQAENASRAKGAFLSSVSHEIRTPMNAILGFSDLLQRTPLDSKQKSYLETIKLSGNILIGLIDEILDFSRIESGRIELEEIDFDLRRVVDEVLAVISPAIDPGLVEISCQYLPEGSYHYKGDPSRIRQILLNLLSNAAKFTKEGKITITLRRLPERTEDGKLGLAVSVKDTGIGISKDKQRHIFEMFAQGDSSTSRRFGGSGLGLAIARGLAHKMGGEIKVFSEAGCGSEFTATLFLGEGDFARGDIQPSASSCNRTDPIPEQRSPNDMRPLEGLKILVAEDDEASRKLLECLLDSFGCQSDYACDGRQAIRLIEQNSYHLCLMDLWMPAMGGLEAARIIRSKIKSAVPIVALTAAVMAQDRDQAIAAGMNDYLTKPLNAQQLQAKILEWVSAAPAGPSPS